MSNYNFFERFKESILKLISPDTHKILVAVSGGVDSIVLVSLLKKLNVNFAIAHCNFKLRDLESDEDEKFVQNLAKELNVSFYTTTFDTKNCQKKLKLSLQEIARKLRYEWFEELKNQHHFDYIATAHHLNDSIETILLNLVHGTGIRGLHGIQDYNPSGNIIRPLSQFSKNEIMDYASQEALKFREDSSNLSLKYERNKIRKQVIPVFETLNPGLYRTFSDNIAIFKEVENLYQYSIQKISASLVKYDDQSCLKIFIPGLKETPAPVSILFETLRPYGFNQRQIFQIFEHLEQQSGAVYYSENYKLSKCYDHLILEKNESFKTIQNQIILEKETKEEVFFNLKARNLILSFHAKTTDLTFDDPNIVYFDADKVKYPLTVRNPEPADFFYPFGMSGKKKKLSTFFKDLKIDLTERKNIELLCSANKIIWVIGLRTDDRFKVDENTSSVLKIKII